jgi:hypothetical protein
VINHLIRVEMGQYAVELARLAPKATLTYINGLEKQGFVEMRPNPRTSAVRFIFPAGKQFSDGLLSGRSLSMLE